MHRVLAITVLGLCSVLPAAATGPPTPEEFLGHPVGADRKLAPWPRVVEYLRQVDAASDRVQIESAGLSTLGNEIPVVILSSAANLERQERWREIARRLANPDELTAELAEELIAEGKAIVLVTCTIHSTEVGSTQMAMEFVWQFATTTDPRRTAWMDDVVMLLMPSINPDGQVLVIDWYEKYLGTEYEGGRMPWLYHPYVGHDNNRDFYMLTQKESRAVNDVLYHRWFPQVFVDEHQMGSTGPRMFVPPQTDPLAPEIHSLIFRQADLIGTNMSYRLEEAGKTGVGHNMIFDSYWPGGTRNTAWWKNVTGLLTEVASARIASPIYIDPGELSGGAKGLPEYKRQANFPSPWRGGWWRLRDIVDYELVATWALVETASQYRSEILRNFYRIGLAEIEAGRNGEPAAWIVPPDQHDPVAAGRLVELLLRHGVRLEQATEPLHAGRQSFPAGTTIVPAAQPYRAFLLTMLRPQRYPEVRPYGDGPVIPPYDVTSWSLPISMGVEVVEVAAPPTGSRQPITRPAWPEAEVSAAPGGWLVSHAADTAATLTNRLLAAGAELYWLADPPGGTAGDLWLPPAVGAGRLAELAAELHLTPGPLAAPPAGAAYRLRPARVGLYKPWMASMDEGWTRWLLERYEFPFVNLNNEAFRDGSFADQIDTLLLPDVGQSIIESGEPEDPQRARFRAPLPPEYAGGLGPEGGAAIARWVREGGTAVALDSSGDYLIGLLDLPVANVLDEVPEDRFSAPGTMLRILVDTEHPLGYGMRPRDAAYFAGSPAFRTGVPDARFDRRVVARYPDHRDDIPLSGYIRGAELLQRRAAAVEVQVGKGRVILIGFRPQHRAQPHRTFKLLFNALFLAGAEETELRPAES
jgi:hypothetical protein